MSLLSPELFNAVFQSEADAMTLEEARSIEQAYVHTYIAEHIPGVFNLTRRETKDGPAEYEARFYGQAEPSFVAKLLANGRVEIIYPKRG